MIGVIKYLQARLKTVVVVCYVLLAVIAACSNLVDTHHAHTWVEQHVPCFWSLFGFAAGCRDYRCGTLVRTFRNPGADRFLYPFPIQ